MHTQLDFTVATCRFADTNRPAIRRDTCRVGLLIGIQDQRPARVRVSHLNNNYLLELSRGAATRAPT